MVNSDAAPAPGQTRLCDLPWRSFRVDTQVEPPRAAPCRRHAFDWDARSTDQVADGLQAMRRNLLSGSPAMPCRTCPDKPEVPVADLVQMLRRAGLVRDGNLMLDAIAGVAQSQLPVPPEDLMYRVAHTRDAADFLVSGLITFFDFLPLIERHDRSDHRRLLDWGCGSGRLAIHLAARLPDLEVAGCDIDAEAVRWCRDHLGSGDFRIIDPLPPTDFPRNRFTTITGYSVVTHLDREHQLAWVDELHDLLVPGGIVVLTTMGETAADRHGLAGRLAVEGIVDDRPDPTLGDIAPPGYYRSTFQSREFTEQAWGSRFELLEYLDAGAFNFQDIVVLRRRS